MKRQLRYLTGVLAAALAVSGCGSSGPPAVLSYDGSFDFANILVTVVVPGEDFFEYEIQCVDSEASIIGTEDLNAHDACTSLSMPLVSGRLTDGRSASGLCSTSDPQVGQIQFFGYLEDELVNTAVDRSDGCGQREWDELLQYIAVPPSAAVQD